MAAAQWWNSGNTVMLSDTIRSTMPDGCPDSTWAGRFHLTGKTKSVENSMLRSLRMARNSTRLLRSWEDLQDRRKGFRLRGSAQVMVVFLKEREIDVKRVLWNIHSWFLCSCKHVGFTHLSLHTKSCIRNANWYLQQCSNWQWRDVIWFASEVVTKSKAKYSGLICHQPCAN